MYTVDATLQERIEYNRKCEEENDGPLQTERDRRRLGGYNEDNAVAEQLQREANWNGENVLDALPENVALQFVAALDNHGLELTREVLDRLHYS